MNGTRKFLIASHGSLASGIKSSLDIIVGEMDNVFLIEAYLAENKSIEEEVNEVMNTLGNEDELIIFTDLLGGSVTNQMAVFTGNDNVHLVAGFNLALIIEVLLSDAEAPIAAVIESAVNNAKSQMAYVNRMINSSKEKLNHD
ncbi:PTS sugar transporter subunit IIA [Daejeonella lutea]|uniref:PTS system, mannose-specific IIA component n=1 Tax=Daejeonella lutea TaxID=572036 RepID=A0A1T5F7S5_9SPHI|nr:PTS sugar transporter subunit IIA [Daejeonella lutea]SKB92216.1 PTS system, mannose-specific IIA component [Daejeonella lutea]